MRIRAATEIVNASVDCSQVHASTQENKTTGNRCRWFWAPLVEFYTEVERRRIAQQLATVSEAAEPKAGPGRGHKSPTPETNEDKTEGHDVPSFPLMHEREAKRLRAINRAPDVVQDAYREGRISQTLAAKLGPKNPTPEVAAKVAEVAGEIRKIKDRKEVDRVVRDRLGQQKPTIVEQAFRLVERMTPAERSDFELARLCRMRRGRSSKSEWTR